MNDDCMEMTSDDVNTIIKSCRKRLGKSASYSGNLVIEEQASKGCNNPQHNHKGFGK